MTKEKSDKIFLLERRSGAYDLLKINSRNKID